MAEKKMVNGVNVECVFFRVEADISVEQKEEMARMAQKYSPAFNSIAQPVPVRVELEKG